MNEFGTPTDNKVADAANLILMNKDFIAREAVDRMYADIPYTISSKRHFDAYNLIQANKDFIVWEAYYLFKTIDYPAYTHAQGYTEQDCRDDLMDILKQLLSTYYLVLTIKYGMLPTTIHQHMVV